MAKRLRRKGSRVTFSVSVDRETQKLLRDIADEAYGGNVSELITQIAQRASRQQAAMELLRLHGMKPMSPSETEEFKAEIAAELAAQGPKKKKKKRRVA
jgi:hypothetical protein